MTPTEIIESVVAGAELLIAAAAFLALRQTRGEIAANREASERAERHLLEERARTQRQRIAEQELQRVQFLAEMTSTADPYVQFSPLERGKITAALDGLPPGHLPLTESFWLGDETRKRQAFGDQGSDGSGVFAARKAATRYELAEHMRCLVEVIASGESEGG